jgi:hypothetical protein
VLDLGAVASDYLALLFCLSDGSGEGGGDHRAPGRSLKLAPEVADLLQKLNLTAEEGGLVDFSDDEDVGGEKEVM